jgi:beta-galactosidase
MNSLGDFLSEMRVSFYCTGNYLFKTSMKKSISLVAFFVAVLLTASAQISRERISLDDNWRFTKGDSDGIGDALSYAQIKDWLLPTSAELTTNADVLAKKLPTENPTTNVTFAQPEFNDSRWRLLNLPHDWGIEGPFDQSYPGETGKLPWWGVAWYRKHLEIPAADAGKNIFLDVDGAMSYASVWVNGRCAGGWPYGYASWRVELTPFLKFGADNVIAIRLDNPKQSSRWYPGGGIYRNVWLVKKSPVRVAHWGTAVTTPEVSEKSATVKIKVTVDNSSGADATVAVKNEIFELSSASQRGQLIASITSDGLKVSSNLSATGESQIVLKSPKLWSIENPHRYVVVTTVIQNEKILDTYETPFGIRKAEFTVDKGFFLNGQHVKLNGVCDHHDLGALGAAINTRALERQLEILRSFGVNAIRTSHNPPAPELLDLCDQMGFVVMDEAFDCWAAGKNKNDYHVLYPDWHEQDLRALVRRDRNHPCVILWSSGNEVPDQEKPDGPALAEQHRGIIHSEDPTRPCTDAVSSYKAAFKDFAKHFDVFGWNYKPASYAQFRETNADIPLFGSETSSTVSSRGEYFFPMPAVFETKNIRHTKNDKTALADFQVSSYDYFVPGWATTPDMEWMGQEENPFVAGEFVWTGFDYLGEPTPYNSDASNLLNYSNPADKAKAKEELDRLGKIRVPSRSSYFGIVDLAGFKKDRFYLYQSHWRPDFPMAHILPHWNWPERLGQVTPVFVYTSGNSAELFLNGKSLGLKKKGEHEYRLHWDDVIYQPGELKVVAYKNGKKWATDAVKTTGAPAKLLLSADHAEIAADGKDLSFITVTVADKDGLQVPRSKNHIKFAVEGPGEIVATDNGDATSFESFQAPERNAFNGMALVIVRAKPGQPGEIKLTANAEGLSTAATSIQAR